MPQLENIVEERIRNINTYSSADIRYLTEDLIKSVWRANNSPLAEKLLNQTSTYVPLLQESVENMDTGPDHPRDEACVQIGLCWARLGNFDKAREWLTKGQIIKTQD